MVNIGELTAHIGADVSSLDRSGRRVRSFVRGAERQFKKLSSRILSVQTLLVSAFAGYTLSRLGKSALDVAASFEQMRVKLDALTKGKGQETLDTLNKLALDLPVNTRKLVDSFTMMVAMGLNPTTKSLMTLVDVAVLFGEDAMPRLARALGQMQTLGKLSAEELNQLAEVGINARKYLVDAFGMGTEELQKSGIEIERIIEAIMQGLERDFGGAAKASMTTWQGLTATTKSYFEEIEKTIMEAGVFQELETQLAGINVEIKNWIENNRELIQQGVPKYVKAIKAELEDIWNFFADKPEIIEYGLVGLLLRGKTGLVAGVGAALGLDAIRDFVASKELEKLYGQLSTLQDAFTLLDESGEGTAEQFTNLEKKLSGVRDRINEILGELQVGGKILAPWEVMYAPAPAVTAPKLSLPPATEQVGKGFDLTAYFEKNKAQLQEWEDFTEGLIAHERGLWERRANFIVELNQQVAQKNVDELATALDAESQYLDMSAEDIKQTLEDLGVETGNVWGDIGKDMENAMVGWASSWSSTLTDMLFDADATFGDIGKSFAKMITQMILQETVVGPLSRKFGGMLGGLFTGGTAPPTVPVGGPLQHGAAFTRPTVGLFAESGPEAAMPLVRMPGGDLGVKSDSGKSTNVNMTIMALDARSFADYMRHNKGAFIEPLKEAFQAGDRSLISTVKGAIRS